MSRGLGSKPLHAGKSLLSSGHWALGRSDHRSSRPFFEFVGRTSDLSLVLQLTLAIFLFR